MEISQRSIIDDFPRERLSRAEEDKLAGGSESDMVKLVMHSMREAILYTGRTCHDSIPVDERTSLCYQELMMSARRFKPGRVRFFAFAKPGLRGRMKTHWRAQGAVRNATEMVSVESLISPNSHADGPHSRMVPNSLEVEKEEPVTYFREHYTGEITEPDTDGICNRDQWAAVEKLLAGKLNSRQRMVLTLVYKSGLNYPQIGKLLGVTRSLIHAIHRDAIKLIKDTIAADGRLLHE